MPASLFSGTLSQCDLEKLSKVKCPVSANENERIFALRQSELLDSDADDPMFDRFASLAKRLFNVPIALVTLVDIDRQWFKANIGLEGVTETHRDVAFCSCKYIKHSESCHFIIILLSLNLEDFFEHTRSTDSYFLVTSDSLSPYFRDPILFISMQLKLTIDYSDVCLFLIYCLFPL
jgi:hypothetical protein